MTTQTKDRAGDRTLTPPRAVAFVEGEWGLKVSPSTIRRWVKRGVLSAEQGEHGRLFIKTAALRRVFGP